MFLWHYLIILSAMFDDAISNYKRKIMIQTSAIKFIHQTIIALGS